MHALVVGVGDYPHLLGGSGALTDSHDGMRQLTSPPVSARAMADWLIRDFHHPLCSGGTVSLLLSEKTPAPYRNPVTGEDHDVDRANYANLAAALKAWKDRGDSHVDDMLVFYFCGHGISEGDSMVILPSDFGADADNAYEHAVDFLGVYDAMAQFKARFQCFFVDACRASSDTLGDNTARNPLQKRPRTAEGDRIAPVYYSTLKGEDAHGRAGRISVYTEALMESLNDLAATDAEGDDDWRISNFTLSRALDHLMARKKDTGSRMVQVPDSTEIRSEFYLCHLKQTPRANLYVSSQPDSKLCAAHLVCEDGHHARIARGPMPGDEWAIMVPAGDVAIEAKLDGEVAPRPRKSTRVYPPYKRVTLDLT